MWIGSMTVAFLCPVPSLFIPSGSCWCPGQGTDRFWVPFGLNQYLSIWTSVDSSVRGSLHRQYSGMEYIDANVLKCMEGKSLKYFQKKNFIGVSNLLWQFILNWATTKYGHCNACYLLWLPLQKETTVNSQLQILWNHRYVQWIIIHDYYLHGFAFGL